MYSQQKDESLSPPLYLSVLCFLFCLQHSAPDLSPPLSRCFKYLLLSILVLVAVSLFIISLDAVCFSIPCFLSSHSGLTSEVAHGVDSSCQ